MSKTATTIAQNTASDPWADTMPSTDAAAPWTGTGGPTADTAGAASTASTASTDPWVAVGDVSGNTDWLGGPDAVAQAADPSHAAQAAQQVHDSGFSLHQLWDGSLPVQDWINSGLTWVVAHFRPFFQAVRVPIDGTLNGVEHLLTAIPMVAMVVILSLVAWQFAGGALAIGAIVSLLIVGMLGIWHEAMVTLSLVLTSLAFCIIIGLPLGILLASSDRAQKFFRPVLDAMQTTPAFVYLVPVVMLFGIGNVPGVVVTIVFALPPLVRLTNLGIRQVRPDLIEASRAYGASPLQLLWKVQLPLAMPSIMAGINQALMLSLSMVVIASMIAVGGLGQMVLRGIGRLDMGLATVGGLGIVLLAILLDRITQAMGQPRRGVRHWWQTGPVGLVARSLRKPEPVAPTATANAAQGAHQPRPAAAH
ncbi:glycine betaine/proline transport system permease protein [Comamonas odontotermitis]|uniref:Glycine betaine/proline transport system permease protein n=1 Tax=Comamonas odontotermitis TaxID=379895 RepID=A0ABR6RCX1_9BURK|nr:glycine betaine/L-proline ABC transporter permease ProW [Comamonas odontotermitis]MBB6577008.1 glycine betaine/proline transport system permease protein [Comamonas odontotermitis]